MEQSDHTTPMSVVLRIFSARPVFSVNLFV